MSKRIVLGQTREGAHVFLPPEVRATHMHVIGASNRGKSKFLEGMIRRDILNGEGLCLIDPHGYLYHDLLRWIETKGLSGRRKIVVFDPENEGWSFGFNPLDYRQHNDEDLAFCVDAMVEACAQVWGGEDTTKTPLLKRTLRSVFYALAEQRLSLLEALELTSETGEGELLRRHITRDIHDPVFRDQWERFNALRPAEYREQFASATNRIFEFVSAPVVRRTIGQVDRVLDFLKIMDEGYVLLVNLSAGGRLSPDNARLLGSLMVNDLFLKARRRPPKSRPFRFYLDECALFINKDVGRILDEGRKFGLQMILAHHHLAQLREAGPAVYGAVMTNAQTKVVFGGLNVEDAEEMTKTVFLGELNLEESKSVFDKPTVVRYIREWLQNNSETSGRAVTESDITTESWSETSSEDGDVLSTSEGGSTSVSAATTESHSATEGLSETLSPVLEWLPTQAYSLQEQIHRAMATMVNQPSRRAIVKLPGKPSVQVTVPFVKEGIARDERVEELKPRLFQSSTFATPRQEIEKTLEQRRERLLKEAKGSNSPSEPERFRG